MDRRPLDGQDTGADIGWLIGIAFAVVACCWVLGMAPEVDAAISAWRER